MPSILTRKPVPTKMRAVDSSRISELLAPYLGDEELSPLQLGQVSTYLDLLLKWNAVTNLTSVRAPEEIVTRHFGESFFATRTLFPARDAKATVSDVGSGAGFPGMALALLRPDLLVTLIEAHGKKATFLREVTRALSLKNVSVLHMRAEGVAGLTELVLFRAVEHFAQILPVAANLVATGGRLAGLIGSSQLAEGKGLLGDAWLSEPPVYFPGSSQRLLWISRRPEGL